MWPIVPHDLHASVPTLARSAVSGRNRAKHHTPLERIRDQDVGRLDVPVQLSGLVKRADPFGQLPEGLTQPLLVKVEPGRLPRRGRLGQELKPGRNAVTVELDALVRSLRRTPVRPLT